MLGLCIKYQMGLCTPPRTMKYSQLVMGVAEEYTIWGLSWYRQSSIAYIHGDFMKLNL